jgi:hypothetical protein
MTARGCPVPIEWVSIDLGNLVALDEAISRPAIGLKSDPAHREHSSLELFDEA